MLISGQRTSITGVYYSDSGWSSDSRDDEPRDTHENLPFESKDFSIGNFVWDTSAFSDNATMLGLERPTLFDGLRKWGNKYAAMRPEAGTMILFPTWLPHAADIHFGDRPRKSVAFNVDVEIVSVTKRKVHRPPKILIPLGHAFKKLRESTKKESPKEHKMNAWKAEQRKKKARERK